MISFGVTPNPSSNALGTRERLPRLGRHPGIDQLGGDLPGRQDGRHAGARVRPCTDEVQLIELLGPVVRAEPRRLHERGCRAERRAPVAAQRVAEVQRVDVVLGNDVRAEITALGAWTGPRVAAPTVAPAAAQGVTLATWNQLLDNGSLQDGEPYLAATARPVVAYVSQNTANGIGVNTGDAVKVSTSAGSIEAPVVITVMADNTVWLPTNNDDSKVRQSLHAAHGATVTLSRGGAA